MDEVFLEQMVKRGTKQHDRAVRIGIVLSGLVICCIPLMFGLIISYYVLPVLLMAVALLVWILWRRAAKEYEYIYTEGNLDIDVVYGQSTRQHLVTFDCRQCRLIASAQDERYQNQIYEQRFDKTIRANAGEITDQTYVILGSVGDKQYRVFFDPNETMLNAIHTYSPRNTVLGPRHILDSVQ